MTEIVTTDQGTATVSPAQPAGGVALAEWAAELDHAYKVATAICQTKFAPKEVQGKPEEAAVRMLAGKAVGIDPLSSLSAFYEVHNRPALYARTMVAIAQSQGHQIQRTEATDEKVTYRARRKGESEWQVFTWTIARAEKAGYTSNAKYKSNPTEMLSAKASAEAVRTIAADALMGMAYSVEDLELEDLGEVEDERPKTTVKRKASSRKKAETKKAEPAPEPEPDSDAEPEPALPAEVKGESAITEDTWNELNQLAEEKGIQSVPKWASDQLGRTLHGWGEITEAEGDRLLKILVDGEVQ